MLIFVPTVPLPIESTDRYPSNNAGRHIYQSAPDCAGSAQIVLELTAVAPHVRLVRVNVALPVDHHLNLIALEGDGVDTSGERAWARAIRDQRVNRPFRNRPRAEGGDVRKLQGAPGGCGDLVAVRESLVFGGVQDQFGEQSTCAISETSDVLVELAG
jgi:hypothetical protein